MYKYEPIGFIAITHGVGRYRYWRVCRLVVIPDYQGIGVAKNLLAFIGKKYHEERKLPLSMVTSNPQFIHAKIPNWVISRIGHYSRHVGVKYYPFINGIDRTGSSRRITITMHYVPKRTKNDHFRGRQSD